METQKNVQGKLDLSFLITEDKVQKYYELHQQYKEIEKELNQLKKEIHASLDHVFGENNKGSVEIGDKQIQRQIRITVHYDQEKTVQRLEELQLLDCIETVRKPNVQKIEAALTLGLLTEDSLTDCKELKRTPAIVVRKI